LTYGYLRVSTDRQDENNQKIGVDEKAKRLGVKINEYIIDHGVSGKKEPDKRELGALLKKLKSGDLIIASELSRLGRSLYMVMRILEYCMKNSVRVVTVKDNYELGDNIQSKVLAFAFSLAAEIEWDMTSRRIREALARKKAAGAILGRPRGRKSSRVKLSGHEKEIKMLLSKNTSKSTISRIYGVDKKTVYAFIKRENIKSSFVSITDRVAKHKKTIIRMLKNNRSVSDITHTLNKTIKINYRKLYECLYRYINTENDKRTA
jgi:DNA invertase Pin-like site-specific DNA recombinase